MIQRIELVLVGLSCLSVATWSQDRVWVVDDDAGPGVDFSDIQPAVDAAASGDVVMVRDGVYSHFSVVSKGLSVVGDEGASVLVTSDEPPNTTLVSGIAVNHRVVLRGLDFRPPQVIDGDLVRVESSAGVVWLEELVLEDVFPIPFTYNLNQVQALQVVNCARVVVARCSIRGLPGAFPGFGLESGSRGILATNAVLHLFDTEVFGGATLVVADKGRSGIRLQGSFLTMRDGTSVGGPGGHAGPFGMPGPGEGGPGLRFDAPSVAWPVGVDLVGGAGGDNPFGADGPQGPSFTGDGSINEHAAVDVDFETQEFVRDDDDALFDVATEPGAPVFLLANLTPDPLFLSGFPVTLGVGVSPFIVTIGPTDGTGQLSFCVGIPDLPASVDFLQYTLQVLVFAPGTGLEFSNSSVVTIVQEEF